MYGDAKMRHFLPGFPGFIRHVQKIMQLFYLECQVTGVQSRRQHRGNIFTPLLFRRGLGDG